MLAPLVLNSAVGFTLFSTYGLSEAYLKHNGASPLLTPAIAGFLAGSAQSCISSPLDNIRFVINEQTHSKRPWPGWISVLKSAARPSFLLPVNHPADSTFTFARSLKRFASRGWSMFSLTFCRDSLGFMCFFSVFEAGRTLARNLRNQLAKYNIFSDRLWIPRTLQAICIICFGGVAGLAYGTIGRPFDVARAVIWESRVSWAKKLENLSFPTQDSKCTKAKYATICKSSICIKLSTSSCSNQRILNLLSLDIWRYCTT